jgi:hypothetical protein
LAKIAADRGTDINQFIISTLYIESYPIPETNSKVPIPEKEAEPSTGEQATPSTGGRQTGRWIYVPDPVNDPLTYWHFSGKDPLREPAIATEVWEDDIGCYYLDNESKKHRMPDCNLPIM